MVQRWIDVNSLWEEDPEPEARDTYKDFEERMKTFVKTQPKPTARRPKGKRVRSQMPM